MKIQLWSYNYAPEPSGIGPLSTAWAEAMRDRGHELSVVAAHPHYPEPRWGHRVIPYRETRNGIPVLRLPLVVGRKTALRRVVQEASFATSQTLALPALDTPDVVVAVSPSFPALIPAMLNARLRHVPWVLWLQDILPDGATATGIVKEGRLIESARYLERLAYRSAAHIVVISDHFRENLRRKGVPSDRITRIYNMATRPIADRPLSEAAHANGRPALVLCMGNIGHTQGLAEIVRAYESDDQLARTGTHLVLAGAGVAADEVRQAIRTDRVEMKGLLLDGELDRELAHASLGAVTQRQSRSEFNMPSKLMNYLACGLPIIASVRPDSEVARIIRESGSGWVTDCGNPAEFPAKIREILADPEELARRGRAGLEFARVHMTAHENAGRFDAVLESVLRDRRTAV